MPALRPSPNSPAGELATALNARRSGRGWVCRCPAHQDRNPSLSIGEGDDGKVLVKCHAGCSQDAVIAALRARGLWDGFDRQADDRDGRQRGRHPAAHERILDDVARIERATTIWNEGCDPRGTVAVEYLAARKLRLPDELCGDVLRFHPACHWELTTAPCLIAAFRSIADDSVKAIHRIRVDQPERWPKAQRMMLGPVAGCAIKLDAAGDCLVIGEGLETSMAARQLGLRPVWALGSAGAIEKFLPVAGVNHLVVLGENDASGKSAKAAEVCRQHWNQHHVAIVKPRAGKDLNDLIMGN